MSGEEDWPAGGPKDQVYRYLDGCRGGTQDNENVPHSVQRSTTNAIHLSYTLLYVPDLAIDQLIPQFEGRCENARTPPEGA